MYRNFPQVFTLYIYALAYSTKDFECICFVHILSSYNNGTFFRSPQILRHPNKNSLYNQGQKMDHITVGKI